VGAPVGGLQGAGVPPSAWMITSVLFAVQYRQLPSNLENEVCTGYVIAKWESMHEYSSWVPQDALCAPPGTEYEDMVQVVVSWTELRLRNPDVMSPFDFRTLTEAALRNTWGCKK
jgi:hypothetical protein